MEGFESGMRRVIVGSKSWAYRQKHYGSGLGPLLLPPGDMPSNYRWPVRGKFVSVIPQGSFDLLERAAMKNALLHCGASAGIFVDTHEWFGEMPEGF